MTDDDDIERRNTYDADRNVLYVRERRCDTCIFGRNRPVSSLRVRTMIAQADAERSSIPCHHHLYVGEDIHPICRGYWDHALRDGNNLTLRLAQLLEIVEFT